MGELIYKVSCCVPPVFEDLVRNVNQAIGDHVEEVAVSAGLWRCVGIEGAAKGFTKLQDYRWVFLVDEQRVAVFFDPVLPLGNVAMFKLNPLRGVALFTNVS